MPLTQRQLPGALAYREASVSIIPQTKWCNRCQRFKTFDEFAKKRAAKTGLQTFCRVCHKTIRANPERGREQMRKWRAANPERNKATRQCWKEANAEKVKAQNKEWYQTNSERVKKNVEYYRAANPEKVRAWDVKWRTANPEKVKAMGARWQRKNPEKVRGYVQKRRALKLAVGGSFAPAEFEQKIAQYQGRCHWCYKKISGKILCRSPYPIKTCRRR